VLGTRVLQLDGHSTRSGGNLVKNVTGYDLHRLYCGSHGSLVLVLEASLRLFPEPEATLVASTTCDELELAVELAAGLGSLRVAPRAVTIENGLQDGTFDLHVVLAGLPEHLELELGRIAPLLRDPRVARGAQAAAQRERLRDLEPDARERPVLHVTSRAARLRPTLGELFEALGPHAGARLVVQPALASLDLAHDFGADEECAATLLRIRRALAPLGASATLRGARPLSSTFAELVADPLRAELTERLRRAYDPAGLLCTRPPLGGLR
jgi:FAD/FMN-containing dehydrogenase